MPAAAPGTVRLATYAMGTRFELALVGDRPSHLRAVGEAALGEVQYLHEKCSYFSSSSMITHINQHAAMKPVNVDRELFDLLLLCRDVWERSAGAFDITISPAMRRCGFRPCDVAQADDAGLIGMQYVELDEAACTVRFTEPGLTLDLGGIAKGYALDRAAELCREHDVDCGLLHGGTSSVIAMGSPPDDDRGWAVQIRDEFESITVHLRDAALGVSAPRGRSVSTEQATYGHVMDPRSGVPATGATTAAVIADSGALADAWSTALLVTQSRPASMPETISSFIHLPSSGWHQQAAALVYST